MFTLIIHFEAITCAFLSKVFDFGPIFIYLFSC